MTNLNNGDNYNYQTHIIFVAILQTMFSRRGRLFELYLIEKTLGQKDKCCHLVKSKIADYLFEN